MSALEERRAWLVSARVTYRGVQLMSNLHNQLYLNFLNTLTCYFVERKKIYLDENQKKKKKVGIHLKKKQTNKST